MEMFHLQKTGQRKRTILSGMWETLAGMRGFILCQQPSRDSSGRSFCGGQLSSPVAWEAQLFSESTPSPKQSSRSTERQHAERKGIERARTQRRFERERCFKRDEPATAWPLFGASTSSCPSRMGSGSGRYGLAYSTIFIDPCSGESSDGFGTLASGDTAQAGLGGAQTECRFSPPSDSGGCEGHQYQGEQTSDQGHAPSCHRIGQGTAAIGRSFVRQVPITCIVEAISSCKCAALERIYQKISRSGTSPPSNHCSSTDTLRAAQVAFREKQDQGGIITVPDEEEATVQPDVAMRDESAHRINEGLQQLTSSLQELANQADRDHAEEQSKKRPRMSTTPEEQVGDKVPDGGDGASKPSFG